MSANSDLQMGTAPMRVDRARVASLYRDLLAALGENPDRDGLHHLLPMRLAATIAYRPADRVLGLSKFARIASAHAHRLQLQERIVDGIAADVIAAAGTKDVGVVAIGEHLCMSMRGVKDGTARTTSVSLHGRLVEDGALASWVHSLRQEVPSE
ncbi:MAG: GTP cyclohydrolase I [Pseudonocardiaceae bacterium]